MADHRLHDAHRRLAGAGVRPADAHVAFKPQSLRIGKVELGLWFVGVAVLAVLYDAEWVMQGLSAIMPDVRLGHFPWLSGGPRWADLTFGLALVAIHEEIFFRRVARFAMRPLGDGGWMVLSSSVLFGLFHWWTGLPNMLLAAIAGAFLMLLYLRAGALWPAIVAHYIIDFWILV